MSSNASFETFSDEPLSESAFSFSASIGWSDMSNFSIYPTADIIGETDFAVVKDAKRCAGAMLAKGVLRWPLARVLENSDPLAKLAARAFPDQMVSSARYGIARIQRVGADRKS